jgi:hypothetical protein
MSTEKYKYLNRKKAYKYLGTEESEDTEYK